MKTLWQNLHNQSKGMLFAHGYLSTATVLAITGNEKPAQARTLPMCRTEGGIPQEVRVADCAR